MAKYQEKREPLYVEILPAAREHIAVMPTPVHPGEEDDPNAVIGELLMPDGLVQVTRSHVIIDYGEKTSPRYVAMPARDVDAFFEPVGKKAKAQLAAENKND